jgi:hypothetical protein
MYRAALLLTVALLLPPAIADGFSPQKKASALFAPVLETFGLGHLSDEDKAKVETLVLRATERDRDRTAIEADAALYMEQELGFSREWLEITSSHGRDVLVSGRGASRYCTTDVPFLLNRYSFRRGDYYVKRGFEGVNEFISDGRTYSLRFATWRSC